MKRVSRFLWVLVGVGLALYAGLTLWLAFSGIFFPYQLDYGEGDVSWFTRQLALGQPIYFTLGMPYTASNYPPVYMLLAGSLYRIFGDSFLWGRWLNFAATLLVAAMIARVVRVETRAERTRPATAAPYLAALLFFGSTFVYHWVPLFRVDMPGIAFTLAGVLCVWEWGRGIRQAGGRRQKAAALTLAVLFFLLAFYTKQSLVFAPLAACLAVYLRNRRAAIFFGLALAFIGSAIFAALEIGTHGGWSFGIISLNATVWTPRVFVPLITSFLFTYAVLLLLGVWGWWARVMGEKKIGVLEIYAIAALASIALAGREGAWENYFFEAIVMTSIFAGLALARFRNAPRWQWALPLTLLLQLGLFWNEHNPNIAQALFDQVRVANADVVPLVRAANGMLVSEDMGLLHLNGKPVVYYSFPYSTLARAGHYDQSWELNKLRTGNFALVILMQGTREDVDHFGNFTHAFVSALDYGYRVTRENVRYRVYTPAPLQHLEPNAIFGDTFELVGWSLEPAEPAPDKALQFTLDVVWQAHTLPPQRYTSFAHLENAVGDVVAQDDHESLHGAFPTTHWTQGEMVRDMYSLHVTRPLPPGNYFLRVGWYATASQDRLSTAEDTDFVELTKIVVPQ